MKCKSLVILLGIWLCLFWSVALGADDFYVIPVRNTTQLDDRYVNVTGDTMTGDLKANGFLYGSDQNTYLSIPGLAFLPGGETLVYVRGAESPGPGLESQETDQVTYVAPVYLPHGAKIWNMTVWFYRSTCTSATCYLTLYETEMSDRTNLTYDTTPLLQISTTSCNPVSARTGIQFLAGYVDNELKTYFLEAKLGSPRGSYTTIRWVRIDYSVDKPLP
jgi:hypothetical protein